ncbi:hypothetical protein X797_002444 [Metarhizium robertsii]|uniref:Uncharacterized protein n=2 Tax=Metarhizium robertsii TaxID=568076 RepID=E9EZ23_METRA|nr:uncharacterized protein MAA_05272 [Metarhizium robertsii ARSEF 23]EFY99214.1 hypothetical protein MAA_05272 [Metarhizium robertsii ARSEF 23]EXV04762.1 hypothetical protein X797_002444 [Metarhizium robertsii]
MATLNSPLNKIPIDYATRSEIIESFWPANRYTKLRYNDLDWESYFRFYTKQCHDALIDQGRHVLARTHQDIYDIVRRFEDLTPRDEIKKGLRSRLNTPHRHNEDDILDRTIDLAARLHLMVNIAVDKPVISGQVQLRWVSGILKEHLNHHFSEPQVLGNDGIKLEQMFTAVNLERIAGIRIKPTDNLADHLRMIDEEDKVVAIFHHTAFLRRQTSCLYPDGLREETLRTLSLLFPRHDEQTRKWLRRHPESYRIDMALLKCDPMRLDNRQIEKFHFWHDRLIILKQAFDQSRPATISQWWWDRRNGVQWYTFWVAIVVLFLTIFFGMVQSVEGALQVYKAFHPS